MYSVTRDGAFVSLSTTSTDRVKDLKAMIHDRTGVPPVMQRLTFCEHHMPEWLPFRDDFDKFEDFVADEFPLLPSHQFLRPELYLQIICIRRHYRITKKRRVEKRDSRPFIDHLPVWCRISKKRYRRCTDFLS